MDIAPRLAWMDPYIKTILIEEEYNKIKHVKEIHVSVENIAQNLGLCRKHNNKNFTIHIAVDSQYYKLDKQKQEITILKCQQDRLSLLETLSHELAHLKKFNDGHGVEFWIEHAKLLAKIMKLAKKWGEQDANL